MTLPPNFSHWEHLQDMLRREHNKAVARYFKDVGGIDWEPTVNTPRAALRLACTLDDKDTVDMTILRMYLFYEILGYSKKRLGVFYGMPSLEFQEKFEGRPQVFLYFTQDKESIPDRLNPVTAEISFRLMNETSQTMTEAKALTLANASKREFIENGKGIYFAKGKDIVSYIDKQNGYQLKIFSLNEKEGEKIIKNVLAVRGHPFDASKMSVSIPKRTSVSVAKGTKLVYGKQRKNRRWRPSARVRFRQAYMYIHGLDEIVPLVDTGGQWVDALVKV
ncbi:hypothetical protein NIES4101_28870 [Calothrix sp. NIES-4101]|nr:hypothetical protein NIES4101_28870 [Calothrix sp. NIES-4101]